MENALLGAAREAVLLVLLLSAPPLLAALAVGLVVGVLQAATQVQDPSVALVPRVVAVFLALGVAAPWIGGRVVRFAAACFEVAARSGP